MSVHYKFKSNLSYDTVTFDGLHISIGDLKKSIMHQKKIGKSADFDLQITNAQTNEVYSNEDDLIPKNSSVTVARVPIGAAGKKSWERNEAPLLIQDSDSPGHVSYDKLSKTADLVNAVASEDDKIKAMMTQSTQEYDPSKYVKSRSMTGPLPPNYTCYRCGKQGHWIKNCPTNNLDIKRSTGIPRSFMVPVDGPEHKGALLTATGEFAVPLIDHQAYKEVKKEKPPFLNEPEMPVEPEKPLPEELLCMVCRDLLQDAVLIPCCGNSFCDECVRQVLLDSENHECPMCHETSISPDNLIPNRFLRTAVLNFKNETGYTRMKKLFQPSEEKQPTESAVEATKPAVEVVQPVEADSTVVDDDGRAGTPLADEHNSDVEAPSATQGGSAYSSPSNSIPFEADVPPPGEHPAVHSPEQTIMTITTRGPDYMHSLPPPPHRPQRSFTKESSSAIIPRRPSKPLLAAPPSHHSRGPHLSSHRNSPTHSSLPHRSLHRPSSRYGGSTSHSRDDYEHSQRSMARFTGSSLASNRLPPAVPIPPPIIPIRHALPPLPFPPQPPPPGASPHSHVPPPPQPPPPGVGPVHPIVPEPPRAPPFPHDFNAHAPPFPRDAAFHASRDRNWASGRDTYEDITRKFIDYHQNRPSHRRRSHSHSRSYSSSKSRSRSYSPGRWSRSRSRSSSFSRSYSRSRSRSYSRSRSRSRERYYRSRSRSPAGHRKNRSPRRYYRSRSRSPRKYPVPHYSHGSRMDYPPDYYGLPVPPFPPAIPPGQSSHFKVNRPGSFYHENFPEYDGYPGRFSDTGDVPYNRYGHNYYPENPRKPHLREWDLQYGRSSVSQKDVHGNRLEDTTTGALQDKAKENSDAESLSKKKDGKSKTKSSKHHHHHRHREGKKSSSKSVDAAKKEKSSGKHTLSIVKSEDVAKKDEKTVSKERSEQSEVQKDKEKKHRHKKGKDGEASKKRKKKSESEDAQGSELEKPKKKKKKITSQAKKGESKPTVEADVPETNAVQSIDTNISTETTADTSGGVPLVEESLSHNLSKSKNENVVCDPSSHDHQMVADDELEAVENAECKSSSPIEGEDPESGEDEATISEELRVTLPEISKWERDDSDSLEDIQLTETNKPETEETKTTLSSDIIQKAEKALLRKAPKSAIVDSPIRRRQTERATTEDKNTSSSARQKSERDGDKEKPKPEKFVARKLQRNAIIKFGEIRNLRGSQPQEKKSTSEQSDTKSKDDTSQKSSLLTTVEAADNLLKQDLKKHETNLLEMQKQKKDDSKKDENPGKPDQRRDASREKASYSSSKASSDGSRKDPKGKNLQESAGKTTVRSSEKCVERNRKEKLVEVGASDGSKKKKETLSRTSSGAESSKKGIKSSFDGQVIKTEDESVFEPNYDETSDDDSIAEPHSTKKRKVHVEEESFNQSKEAATKGFELPNKPSSEEKTRTKVMDPKHPKITKEEAERIRREHNALKKQLAREVQSYVVTQRKRTDSASSNASSSSSDSESDESSTKKVLKGESTDSDQKHRHKKSKHRKHKKRKHKHKKKKSHRGRERDREETTRLSSSVVRR